MDDLISRAATLERMKSMAGCATCDNYNYVRCRACIWDDAMNIVDEVPAVDAVPNGRWIDQSAYDDGTVCRKCSECHDIQIHYNTYYPTTARTAARK